MAEQLSWSIIVLAYNEGDTLKRVIDEIISVFEPRMFEYEILVINDGSTDNTSKNLETYNTNTKIRIINHDKNMGIGYSLVEGYKSVKNNIIGMIPGDGQFEIALINKAINLFIDDNKLMIVSFYRNLNRVYSRLRKTVTKIQKLINSFVLGVKFMDVNWVKFMRIEILGDKNFCMKSSLIETEIMYVVTLRKYRFVELPSDYLDRGTPRSKLSFIKSFLLAAKDVFKLLKLKRYYKKIIK